MVIWGALAAVGGAVIAQTNYALLGERADSGPLRLLTGAAHGQMPLWLISSVGGAVLIIGASLRWQTGASRVRGLIADTGRFAFTAYVLHVLVLTLINPSTGSPRSRAFSLPLPSALPSALPSSAQPRSGAGHNGQDRWNGFSGTRGSPDGVARLRERRGKRDPADLIGAHLYLRLQLPRAARSCTLTQSTGSPSTTDRSRRPCARHGIPAVTET